MQRVALHRDAPNGFALAAREIAPIMTIARKERLLRAAMGLLYGIHSRRWPDVQLEIGKHKFGIDTNGIIGWRRRYTDPGTLSLDAGGELTWTGEWVTRDLSAYWPHGDVKLSCRVVFTDGRVPGTDDILWMHAAFQGLLAEAEFVASRRNTFVDCYMLIRPPAVPGIDEPRARNMFQQLQEQQRGGEPFVLEGDFAFPNFSLFRTSLTRQPGQFKQHVQAQVDEALLATSWHNERELLQLARRYVQAISLAEFQDEFERAVAWFAGAVHHGGSKRGVTSFAYFDDASYTGVQLLIMCSAFLKALTGHQNASLRLPGPHIHLYLCIPFSTTHAKDKVTAWSRDAAPWLHVHMYDKPVKLHMAEEVTGHSNLCNYGAACTFAVFEHKLPDLVSLARVLHGILEPLPHNSAYKRPGAYADSTPNSTRQQSGHVDDPLTPCAANTRAGCSCQRAGAKGESQCLAAGRLRGHVRLHHDLRQLVERHNDLVWPLLLSLLHGRVAQPCPKSRLYSAGSAPSLDRSAAAAGSLSTSACTLGSIKTSCSSSPAASGRILMIGSSVYVLSSANEMNDVPRRSSEGMNNRRAVSDRQAFFISALPSIHMDSLLQLFGGGGGGGGGLVKTFSHTMHVKDNNRLHVSVTTAGQQWANFKVTDAATGTPVATLVMPPNQQPALDFAYDHDTRQPVGHAVPYTATLGLCVRLLRSYVAFTSLSGVTCIFRKAGSAPLPSELATFLAPEKSKDASRFRKLVSNLAASNSNKQLLNSALELNCDRGLTDADAEAFERMAAVSPSKRIPYDRLSLDQLVELVTEDMPANKSATNRAKAAHNLLHNAARREQLSAELKRHPKRYFMLDPAFRANVAARAAARQQS
ncbi:hypothetical protein COO60DRAFT_1465407 [Scenedesmus sp. NREL 46B-D3]|nr:hypothetical protein COO60DRAFT_1465407 [Scenedesmus sp. NREL 46B-D3]